MDDKFYDSWLLVGDEEHLVAETFPVVELVPSTSVESQAVIPPPAGYCCQFANKLRNSNCYQNLNVPVGSGRLPKKISDVEASAIRVSAQRLVVESRGAFYLYDNDNVRLIQRQQWWGRGSGVSMAGARLYAMDEDLCEYSLDGALLSEVIVSGASDLFFHEVTPVNARIFIAGFESFRRMEAIRGECGFIRAFKIEEISPPQGSLQLSKVQNERAVAFFDDLRIIPVFLDDLVIQPMRRGVAVFNYDLKVVRMIIGGFVPYYASAGLNSDIYMSAAVGDTDRLLAFTADGFSYFNVEIPKSVGEPSCPPLVSTDGNIYVVGQQGVAAYDPSGKSIWQFALSSSGGAGVFAVLFNDQLVVGCGKRLLALKPDGKMLFEVKDFEGEISTPLVGLGDRSYAVGTTAGLYHLVVGK